MQLRLEVDRLQGRINVLESQNRLLKAKIRAEDARLIASFFEWLIDDAYPASGSVSAKLEFVRVMRTVMREWTTGNKVKANLFFDVMSVLEDREEKLVVKVDDSSRQIEVSEQTKRKTIERVASSPVALCEIMRDWDALDRLTAIVSLGGTEVSWTGFVNSGVDDVDAPYQVEVRCGDVIVYCNVKNKRPGSLRGIKKDLRVIVKGRIHDIGDTVGTCTSVLLTDAKVQDEDEYLGLKRQKRRR